MHAVYRLQKVLLRKESVLLLHFDGHPDLSLPSGPPRSNLSDWKSPHKLYEILEDSDGGIAEFILPLFATQCIHEMIWMKPRWSDQFPLGRAQFPLFAHATPPFVDYRTSYYLDNRDYAVPTDEKPSTLVSLTTALVHSRPLPAPMSRQTCWILDICLDYFITSNPYRLELESLIDDTKHLETIISAYSSLAYRQDSNLEGHLVEDNHSRKRKASSTDVPPVDDILSTLSQFINHYPNITSEIADKTRSLYSSRDCSIVDELKAVLPCLTAAAKNKITEYNLLLLLPHSLHHSDEDIKQNIQEVRHFVKGEKLL